MADSDSDTHADSDTDADSDTGATREPEGTEPASAGESPAPARPALSAFAAAIEKKKAAGQARSAHLDGIAKVGGATSSHKTSRTFRRKSG